MWVSKGGGILLRGTPAHSALLGVTPTLPSLHIRATVHVHATQRQGMVNLSLWIIHPFLRRSEWAILISFFLLFYTFCIYIEHMLSSPPNSALFKKLWSTSWRKHLQLCRRILQLSKYQQIFQSGCKLIIVVGNFFPSLFSFCQLTNKSNYG